MKHDDESETLQNEALVRLGHVVAGCCAHAGFSAGVAEAHAVIRSLVGDYSERLPEGAPMVAPPVAELQTQPPAPEPAPAGKGKSMPPKAKS